MSAAPPTMWRRARGVWLVASVLAVVAWGCGNDKPPPIWLDRTTLDTSPLVAACGPEDLPEGDRRPISEATRREWGRHFDNGVIYCGVSFNGDRVYMLMFNIYVSSRPEEIGSHVDASLGALLSLVPPDVAELARRMKAAGRDSTRTLGDFSVRVGFGHAGHKTPPGHASFFIEFIHRPTERLERPRPPKRAA